MIFLISLSSHADLHKVSLQLKWKHQFQFAGYYMALEKGFYKQVGLEVEIKEAKLGINLVDEVLNGHSTYAVGRTNSLIDISQGKKIVYLAAIYQSSPLVLMALQSANIKKITDIRDLRIMLTGDKEIDAVLIAMMLSQGINYSDIQLQAHSYNINDLIQHKTDLMTAYISNEPFLLREKGIKSILFHPKNYGFDFYNDLLFTSQQTIDKDPEQVRNFKAASLEGWKYAFDHIEETVAIILNKYNSQNKSRAAYIFEANELKKLAYYHTDQLGKIERKTLEKTYEIYKILGLAKGDINLDKAIYQKTDNELNLNYQELKYLQAKKVINMCVDPDWLPFTHLKNGDYTGISADIYKLIKEELPIPLKVIETQSWSQTITFAKARKCDIIDFAIKTSEREVYLNFTEPFLKVPLVIATRHEVPFIANFKSLQEQKLALLKTMLLLTY
ncbi:ABC transporter substrate-binding protein [sulfur-oxidizing endosymbiont of Gigantopelta aegis]|uniref:ABC transporter substrate-binding protein n=1 Tax=sulfur-oxidizing endosymbiont of Gigantopelta aegis TaxID=2794934 RepID=UPI0018DD30F2|nr:ABC transporter substrate-binding protein [sulfur-oxidizing endosymbiont of Gigantopelta aegis]